jgi:hypothetical protein
LKTRNGPPTKLDYGPAHGSSYAGEEEIVDHHSVDDFLFIHLLVKCPCVATGHIVL